MVCFFFNMDVGSFLRKLFGEPVRGANIFLFGPNKLHTTKLRSYIYIRSVTKSKSKAKVSALAEDEVLEAISTAGEDAEA